MKKYINMAVPAGLLLVLLPLVVLLAPFTPIKALAYGVIWLFGLPFYWGILPLVMVLGFLILLKGFGLNIRFGNWMIYLGIFCLYLGTAIFLSKLRYFGNDLSFFEMVAPLADGSSLLVLESSFAGGAIGYLLLILFQYGGEALIIAAFVFLWLLGAFLILFLPMRVIIYNLSGRELPEKKAKAKKEKKSQKFSPFEDDGGPGPMPELHPESYAHDENDELPPFEMSDLSDKEPTFATKEIPVRSNLKDHPIDGIPVEIADERKISHSKRLSTSGLKEATFSFDEDDPEDYLEEKPSPQPYYQEEPIIEKKEEPTLEVTTPNLETAPSHIEEVPEEAVEEEVLQEKEPPFEAPAEEVHEEPIHEEKEPAIEEEPPAPIEEEEIEELVPPTPEPIKEEAKPEPKPQPKKEKKPFVYLDDSLLKTYDNSGKKAQLELDCAKKMDMLNEVYDGLKAGAKVIGYTVGPTVTRFKVQPDPSIPVSKLNQYTKNLSMRLSGASVRFEEVVPGEVTAGLEVPNPKNLSSAVSFKETFNHLPPREENKMYVPFGMTISGDYVSADYADFPHMLVAGGTGSGKSVFIQGIITTLIMRNSPEELRLVIVDPKQVDFVPYHDIPHLLTPIVDNGSKARICLQKLCDEMDKRYTTLRLAGVNKIERYNEEFALPQGKPLMPRILCIIDEFGDLMDTNKDCADSVVRLAQKARAVGIHLLIATQRPTVDVISGRIKGNIATRVALMVKSAIDSQTILNVAGAETLIGKGDMLVDCAGVSQHALVRCQGCFIAPSEIDAICNAIRANQEVEYDPEFLDLVDHEAEAKEREAVEVEIAKSDLEAKSKEDFYRGLVKAVMQEEYTSISKIQRNFGVGFPRAGKLMNRLQSDGIVAKTSDTPSSAKGFRVLIHSEAELPPGLFVEEEES